MSARRSCLSVPGSSEKMLAKAAGLPADEIVIDLEDSVAAGAKAEARGAHLPHARRRRTGEATRGRAGERARQPVVRATTWTLSSTMPARPSARWWYRRWSAPTTSRRSRGLLDERGAAAGVQALVETAAGLLRAGRDRRRVAAARHPDPGLRRPGRLARAGRSRASLPSAGSTRRRPCWWPRAPRGLEAIDGPYLAIADEEGLRDGPSTRGALGYDGKWAIHPRQLAAINARIHARRTQELERARAILAALARAESDGARGAVELDGEMIDEASRKLPRTCGGEGGRTSTSPRDERPGRRALVRGLRARPGVRRRPGPDADRRARGAAPGRGRRPPAARARRPAVPRGHRRRAAARPPQPRVRRGHRPVHAARPSAFAATSSTAAWCSARPVFIGDTLRTRTEVVGLKQNRRREGSTGRRPRGAEDPDRQPGPTRRCSTSGAAR